VLQSQESASLSKENAQHVFTPLADVSAKLQVSISKLNGFHRFVLTALQFVFTGTTLVHATERLQRIIVEEKQLENTYAGKLAYPKLWADAEKALTSLEAYRAVGREYTLPPVVHEARVRGAFPTEHLTNPLLYYLRQALVAEWKKIAELIKSGKALHNPEVMLHVDTGMRISLILTQLFMTHELDEEYSKHPSKNWEYRENKNIDFENHKQVLGCFMGHQEFCYGWFVIPSIDRFYTWIRSYPCADAQLGCRGGYNENRAFINQFYIEGQRPNFWLKIHNQICQIIAEKVDKEVFLRFESRGFALQEDLSANQIETYRHEGYAFGCAALSRLENDWNPGI
jgi:hypothetical protein